MAKLVVRKGRNVGTEHKLNADRLVMGRRSANPIPILDAKSSREHAVILRRDGQFYLQDLSRNGTFLNGGNASKDETAPSPLKFGDLIKIGDTEMEVVDEKAEPIEIEIPGYKILEKIGIGGMGTVYKAKQLSMDRIVALKVLNKKYSTNREFVDRFVREARAAGRLNHPNVIHVHDVSEANQAHYFSMEYIDGNSLKEILRIEGKMPWEKALDLALQTGKALEFAHENQIVHRDIKPDNIMITKDGVVKIADLGIAKTFEDGKDESASQRRVMGTPHYMAPEQALGKTIDHRVDIYSLGATLYHILTAQTPFSGNTAHEVLRAHIQESLPPIQEFAPEVPDALCFVVERMMAKLPEKRYPNMTRLIEDLERVQRGVQEGIERIDVGDSTIQSAVGGKKPVRRQRSFTEELGTGVQSPVQTFVMYAALGVAFAVLVGVIVWAVKRKDTPEEIVRPPEQIVKPPGQVKPPEPPVPATYPEAEKKLEEARALIAEDPTSQVAEATLKDVLSRFLTWPNREAATTLLQEIEKSRKAKELKKVTDALASANAFERAHEQQAKAALQIAAQFRETMQLAQAVPNVYEEAKQKAEQWERRAKERENSAAETAMNQALETALKAAAELDFDSARTALNQFIAAHANASQKGTAEQKLIEIEAEARKILEDYKNRANTAKASTSRGLAKAETLWTEYLKRVKDSQQKGQAEQAVNAIEAEAEQTIGQANQEVTAALKNYNFVAARQALKKAQGILATSRWEERVKAREGEVDRLQQLFENFSTRLKKLTATAPVPLPFEYVHEKFPKSKWGIQALNDTTLNLDAIPRSSAPGHTKKLQDFTGEEQYRIFNLTFSKPTRDEHEALVLYCTEMGLNAEAELHRKALNGERPDSSNKPD